MRIPSQLLEMNVNEQIANSVAGLTGKHLRELFNHNDELRARLREERVYELFGQERFGPQDIKDWITQSIYDSTKEILEASREIFEPIESTIENSYVFIEGSMKEVAEVMEQMGIELPEGLDLIPGASELIIGVRLLLDIKAVNNDFEGVSTNKKVNIAAAKALVTISKFGVTITLSTLGGIAGGAGGAMFAGFGSAVGAPIGTITGAVAAGYINKKIKPYSQDISYKLLGLQKEDLIYYKNKKRIDEVGLKLLNTRKKLEHLDFNSSPSKRLDFK